jgi:hypothetical protein
LLPTTFDLGPANEAAGTVGKDPETVAENAFETQVDLHNNAVGIAIGKQQRLIKGKSAKARNASALSLLILMANRAFPKSVPGSQELDLRSSAG